MKGQIENVAGDTSDPNENIGFKCLHYSVTESAGYVTVTIIKKAKDKQITFGIKTVDGTAVANKEYEPLDENVTMDKGENSLEKKIKIYDNNDWSPDLDFGVELYDPLGHGQ